jgi:hypothetical protein
MHFYFRQPVRVLAAVILTTVFAIPYNAFAQAPEHLVSPQDLSKATQDATQARQQNLATLRGFLSSAKAQQALESAHMNPKQVQDAVSSLSDQELAQLAARANTAQNDFAAGNIGDHDLLLILVVVAVIILIVVAVH